MPLEPAPEFAGASCPKPFGNFVASVGCGIPRSLYPATLVSGSISRYYDNPSDVVNSARRRDKMYKP